MTEQELVVLVRQADPDRFLGAMLAPAAVRRDLLVLYAFNHELARAREVASAPPLALIRLQWWREIVEGVVRAQPLARMLGEAMGRGVFARADLLALIEAREVEAEGIADGAAFMAYASGTSGRLARVAGGVLGIDDAGERGALEAIGTGYAIARILATSSALQALGRALLPPDPGCVPGLVVAAASMVEARVSRRALPVSVLGTLAQRDIARFRRGRTSTVRGVGDRAAVLWRALVGHSPR